jgi:ABC-type multidrug transport system fused ATPase/permease subunit
VRVEATFGQTNDRLFNSAVPRPVHLGHHHAVNFFIGNLNYVAIAVVGGLRVASGQMPLGSVQAFIQYSRMFTSRSPRSLRWRIFCSPVSPRPSASRGAGRRRDEPGAVRFAAAGISGHVPFALLSTSRTHRTHR